VYDRKHDATIGHTILPAQDWRQL